jgi:hypothetical protein
MLSVIFFVYFLGAVLTYILVRGALISHFDDLKNSEFVVSDWAIKYCEPFKNVVNNIQDKVRNDTGDTISKEFIVKDNKHVIVLMFDFILPLALWWGAFAIMVYGRVTR